MRCMKLKPDDLVMVRVKALTGDHKIADQWEDTPHWFIGQLGDQPVFKVQPVNATSNNNIKVLHRNVLFPLKTSEESSPKESENAQNTALMKANLLMDIYFDNWTGYYFHGVTKKWVTHAILFKCALSLCKINVV